MQGIAKAGDHEPAFFILETAKALESAATTAKTCRVVVGRNKI
jgi:hypothetical protein